MIDLKVLRKKERIEFSERAFSYLLSCREGCEAVVEILEYQESVDGLADKPPQKQLFTLVRTKEGFAVYECASLPDTISQQEKNALAPIANEKRSVL